MVVSNVYMFFIEDQKQCRGCCRDSYQETSPAAGLYPHSPRTPPQGYCVPGDCASSLKHNKSWRAKLRFAVCMYDYWCHCGRLVSLYMYGNLQICLLRLHPKGLLNPAGLSQMTRCIMVAAMRKPLIGSFCQQLKIVIPTRAPLPHNKLA